jgi:serine/threonine-protein kinase
MDPQTGAPADILIGQTVGNYLVTQKLGEGGMGSVYLAEHPTIGKKVALKVLHAEFSSNPEVAERFFTEAKAVNAIGHPNIVDIVDYGVIQAGQGGRDRLVYFIMEYLSGTTLSHVIRTESPLAPERALMIALQVADALAASHRCGIVHRDLKPDNIILITRGRERDFVKLLDFGIAKLTGGDGLSSHRTRTGLVLGTPAYMSPEQCEGKPNVDHRTDVYALGICLYEMLVGRVPFIGEGYGEILVQHLAQQPIPPSRYRMMSPHVEAVVLKALEKNPQQRYPTMDEMIRAMSDPVGFVEAHGGITGFLQKTLMPSTAPLPDIRLTPPPMTSPHPAVLHSPVPGTLSPVPSTTLGAASGQVAGSRSKTGFLIGGAVVVVAAIVGVVLVVSSKKSDSSGDTPGSGSTVANAGSMVVTPPPPPALPDAAPVKPPEKGSAEVKTPEPQLPANLSVVVKSDPPGAEIILNEYPTGKKTNTTLVGIPRDSSPTIKLHLHGYQDYTFPAFKVDKDNLVEQTTLQKVAAVPPGGGHTPPGNGKGSAKPPGGKGSGNGNNTNLMRPEDL